MKNCSKDVQNFHDDEVTLTAAQRSEMRERRNANRERLHRGLAKLEKPRPKRHIIQGSYGMKTMTQHPDREYDIDDGAAFAAEDLKAANGVAMTAQQAKQMVADALVAGGGLQTPPEIKKNCVRVNYAAGYHVDIPVYRIRVVAGKEVLELASDDWRESNPTDINDWFASEEGKAPCNEGDEPQLRQQVRMLKVYTRAQTGDKALSGLILTILAAEAHRYSLRQDEAFRVMLGNLLARLTSNSEVRNPANTSEVLTKATDAPKVGALISAIHGTLQAMQKLDRANCRRSEALKVWKDVFKTDYFDADIEVAEEEERRQSEEKVAAATAAPRPWCRQTRA